MATPNFVYINTYAGVGSGAVSAFQTFSFANTAGFDAWIPIKSLTPANATVAGAVAYVYRSTDGGASYETVQTPYLTFPALASGTQTKDLWLRDPGQYLVAVMLGGGGAGTYSVSFGATIAQISAYA